MTKNLTKIFLTICLVSFAILANSAFATEIKSNESKSSTVNTNEDPDLKLSIEELRKKYPIDWLERKYGDSRHPSCGYSDGAFEHDGEIPKNLICTFDGPTPKEKMGFKDFSTKEIKSAFVNANDILKDNRKTGGLAELDYRIIEIIGIAINFFENQPYDELNSEDKTLNSFIYSDKIMGYFRRSIICNNTTLINLKVRDIKCLKN